MVIKRAVIEDVRIAAELAAVLWPHHEVHDLEKDLKDYILSKGGGIFIYYYKNTPAGFAQCGLRHDYVEGTESAPVGYLEGIFVKAEYRSKGIARKLINECEAWAKDMGCSEFASDCELTNIESLKFHLQVGFQEANRIICFKKKL